MVETMEMPKGFKKTDVGIIPNDWQVPKLIEIVIFENGKAHEQFIDEKGDYVVVNSKFISTEGEVRKFSNKNLSPLKKGSITIVMSDIPNGRALAKCYLVEKDNRYTLNQRIGCIQPNEDIDNDYLFYKLNRNKYFLSFDSGSGQTNLRRSEILDCPVPLPPTKAEQTAIAEALNDADALITQLEKLIAKKKAIKQGAMQELLKPKEGWEVKAIGEIAIVGRGRVISHKEISKSIEGKYPVYSSQTFNNGVMGYLDSYDFDGEYLTWTTDGVYAGKVYHRNGQFNCTNVCGTIKLKRDYAPFVAYLLDTITPDHVSRNLANPKLMNDPMKRIKIPLPNHEEQSRIAQILSDMDSEIEVLEKKLDKYKMLKQGMMQNLLTGKIRLI